MPMPLPIDYISSADIVSSLDIDELKEEIHLLKRKTDIEYDEKCKKEEMHQEYVKLIMKDVWYEAAKEYLRCKAIEKEYWLGVWDKDTISLEYQIYHWKTCGVMLWRSEPHDLKKVRVPSFEQFVVNYAKRI